MLTVIEEYTRECLAIDVARNLNRYDGLGRRIVREITNSADKNARHHDYFNDRWQLVETRNGSDQPVKQQVWGLQYIDELVAVNINHDPGDATEDWCERVYFALHDAHYNVIGLTNGVGLLVERYAFSPYGQRQVYSRDELLYDYNGNGEVDFDDFMAIDSRIAMTVPNDSPLHYLELSGDGWLGYNGESIGVTLAYGQTISDDPRVLTPSLGSAAVHAYGGDLARTRNAVGHQGLTHDGDALGLPGFKLVENRNRMLNTRIGRFQQRDPLGYVDGMSVYEYLRSRVLHLVDPWGYASKYVSRDALQSHAAMSEIGASTIKGVGRDVWNLQTVGEGLHFDKGVPADIRSKAGMPPDGKVAMGLHWHASDGSKKYYPAWGVLYDSRTKCYEMAGNKFRKDFGAKLVNKVEKFDRDVKNGKKKPRYKGAMLGAVATAMTVYAMDGQADRLVGRIKDDYLRIYNVMMHPTLDVESLDQAVQDLVSNYVELFDYGAAVQGYYVLYLNEYFTDMHTSIHKGDSGEEGEV